MLQSFRSTIGRNGETGADITRDRGETRSKIINRGEVALAIKCQQSEDSNRDNREIDSGGDNRRIGRATVIERGQENLIVNLGDEDLRIAR